MIESRIGAEEITPAACAPRIGTSVDIVATTHVEISARWSIGAGLALSRASAARRGSCRVHGQSARLAAIVIHTAPAADQVPANELSPTTAARAMPSDVTVARSGRMRRAVHA